MRKAVSLAVCSLLSLFAFGGFAAPTVASSSLALAHGPRSGGNIRLHKHGAYDATSTNWSGYAAGGGYYTDVRGSWIEPTANCSSTPNGYSSFWVGLDGDGTSSVEQLGTDADCSNGRPVYYGWWEMYPNPSYEISPYYYPVSPGDTLSAEVRADGYGNFTLTMSSSRGWTFSTNQYSSSAALGSAEWIAEAPSSSSGVLPLANFGTAYFGSCTANGASISANGGQYINMTTSSGALKAQTSGLYGSGDAFNVTWKHS